MYGKIHPVRKLSIWPDGCYHWIQQSSISTSLSPFACAFPTSVSGILQSAVVTYALSSTLPFDWPWRNKIILRGRKSGFLWELDASEESADVWDDDLGLGRTDGTTNRWILICRGGRQILQLGSMRDIIMLFAHECSMNSAPLNELSNTKNEQCTERKWVVWELWSGKCVDLGVPPLLTLFFVLHAARSNRMLGQSQNHKLFGKKPGFNFPATKLDRYLPGIVYGVNLVSRIISRRNQYINLSIKAPYQSQVEFQGQTLNFPLVV